MILILLKTYLYLLLPIGVLSLVFFILGLYFILGQTSNRKIDDYSAIAGDDVVATQLDLARAYVEIGQLSLAKGILINVLEQGSDSQQVEAQKLLTII